MITPAHACPTHVTFCQATGHVWFRVLAMTSSSPCVNFFYCNKPHTYTYSCTNQVHIQHCTSFNIVRHPQASPCKIKSAGSPFQISAAVPSQLRLNLYFLFCKILIFVISYDISKSQGLRQISSLNHNKLKIANGHAMASHNRSMREPDLSVSLTITSNI